MTNCRNCSRVHMINDEPTECIDEWHRNPFSSDPKYNCDLSEFLGWTA
jgi:hypothetical protein